MASSTPLKILKAPPIPAPTGRRPIGFRGNHQHKKALYDPVFRTTTVPSNLVPRYPIDWRNGGRALLVAAMHKLEGNFPLLPRQQPPLQCQAPLDPGSLAVLADSCASGCSVESLVSLGRRRSGRAGFAAGKAAKRLVLRHKRALQWQEGGFCSSKCGTTCSKSPWRCLCAWRCRGFHQHANRMDAILMSHKGPVECNKPLFSVKRAEVAPSRLASEGMIFCTRRGSFVSTAEKLHPAFAAYDAREKWEVTSVQRSQAVCWGLEEDSETDSDGEENLDEEAEDLLKCLSESQQIGAFERA